MPKPIDQRRVPTPRGAGKGGSGACQRVETRLVLPAQTNPEGAEAALKQVIEDWLLPRLLDEFLKEQGITPKSRFLAKPQY